MTATAFRANVTIELLQGSGVESLRPEQARLIRDLDRRCFPEDARVRPRGTWWFIARRRGRIVGYAGVRETRPGRWFLARVGVLPRYRGQGIAAALTAERIEFARSRISRGHERKCVYTYTATDNRASMNNLIRAGLRIRKNPVGWGRAWLWWEMPL